MGGMTALVASRSAFEDSVWMIALMVGTQPLQQVPAPQAWPTWLRVRAPLRTLLRMVRSETPLQ